MVRMSIEIAQRTAKATELKPYCHFAGEGDFIEVTEWSNLDGYDINVSSTRGEQRISLTHGELEAIQSLIHYKE